MSPFSMSQSDSSFKSLRNHDEYYLSSGDLFLLVENVHFRVHRYFFERESQHFKAQLSTPASPGSARLGTSESNAILIENVSANDFCKLLWVFYNPKYSLYQASLEDWSAILSLADKWDFPEVKALCVRELEQLTFPDVERIALYRQYHIDENLLIPRYAALIARELPLTLEEGQRLGMEIALKIAGARECARSNPASDGTRSPAPSGLERTEIETIVRTQFGIVELPSPPEPTKDEPSKDTPVPTDSKTDPDSTKNNDKGPESPIVSTNGTATPEINGKPGKNGKINGKKGGNS